MTQAAAPGSFGEEGGLTLEAYAQVGVALFGKEGAERDAILAAHGTTAAGLDAAVEGWAQRFHSEPGAALAYNDAYQRAMVAAGVQRPDVPLETYAQMLMEISHGGETSAVCSAHGMNIQEFALLSQHWSEQLGANPALAQRFAALMMSAGPATPAIPSPATLPPSASPPLGLTL
jgi:hypothetical protein